MACGQLQSDVNSILPQRIIPQGNNDTSVANPTEVFLSLGYTLKENGVYAFVSFLPCTQCGQRERGKLAGIYVYWYEGEERVAWKCRYCVHCLMDLLACLKASTTSESASLTICPSCGSDASVDLSGVFLTIYPPKQPEREYALTTCTSCANLLHERFVLGEQLVDRNGAGAAAPAQNLQSEWSQVPW